MAYRRPRVRIASSVALVAGALVVGLPAVGAEAGTSVPHCTARQLSPVFVNANGGAGSTDGEYGFRNHGSRSCELTGYPKVRMLTKSGGALRTTERRAPGAYGLRVRRVTLRPRAVAYFGIHYAAATGYGNLRCPTSAALRLTAPGNTLGHVLHGRGGRIQPFGGTTVHLHCGIVHVSPVGARRFQ